MKTYMKLSILVLILSAIIFNLLAMEYPPDEGDPERIYVKFYCTATVKDAANIPMNNIHIRMTAIYQIMYGGEWETSSLIITGTTNQSGYVYLVGYADVTGYYPTKYSFTRLLVEIAEPDMSILSSGGSISTYPNTNATFVPFRMRMVMKLMMIGKCN